MTTIEPWAELGQTKKQFMAYLLDLTEKRIAEAAAHASPANGQLAARPGHFRYSQLLPGQLEATR